MIVKILSRGKSFKGLATYLTHDPQAKTTERVAWTHTRNLANDEHVPSAVDEMLWTARNAELLKQEAGIRAGGRATENTVKHLSLNWAPDENPTREHMIETAEDFLHHMKWQEHQALLVAHQDKHAHLHVMLNVIHSETGLRLNDDFEYRRAQAWALEYEREHGRIYCEQRLQDAAEREEAPTRPAWMAFQKKQKEFEREENSLRVKNPDLSENGKNPEIANSDEWKILKEIQRHERETFFADGKSAFSQLRKSIYRETREDFRERWADFYAAQKDGADESSLAKIKVELIADQKATLEARRDEACATLRESRNGLYRELLGDQRNIRLDLHARQEAGLDNALFFQRIEDHNTGKEMPVLFHEAADETVTRQESQDWNAGAVAFSSSPKHDRAGMKSGADVGASIATGLGFGLISFAENLFDFGGSKPAPKPPPPEPDPPRANLFDAAFEETRQRQQHEREEADGEWYRKQRSAGE